MSTIQIPNIVPRPSKVFDRDPCVYSLDGTWYVCHTKDATEARLKPDTASWQMIELPTDMNVHRPKDFTGIYIYKREISIPILKEDEEVVLCFEGVNGFASVYVNDTFVARHENGFLTWNVNITPYLEINKSVLLTVVVDENADKVCAFNHGGILHSVYLYILPKQYFTSLRVYTSLHDNGTCILNLNYQLYKSDEEYEIRGRIFDPFGREKGEASFIKNVSSSLSYEVRVPIFDVYKWDAEHPYLYLIELTIWQDGILLERVDKTFGCLYIQCKLNQLYVNGKEVKLRGVCRHEISPYHGRCLTKELIEKDVALFKEANCNYIRTSHYPPSEYFLDLCDRYGIYVEDELDLAFIGKNSDFSQRDPKQTQRYISLFTETYARDFSHPCVLIWSLANEAFGGYNYDILNQVAKELDPNRPTKFSYPMTMQEEHVPVGIWSIHYSNLEEDLAKKCDNVSVGYTDGRDMPVLHDEYAHIPCYNREEQRRDPNVRNFWNESITKFWDKIWKTKGALGGAIWAGIDETDVFCGGNTCLEWGIIDVFRRKKPEHYGVRKAYSPIVLDVKKSKVTGQNWIVPVENRFCHTNLNETTFYWKCGNLQGEFKGPDLEPRHTSILMLPYLADKPLEIYIVDSFCNQVDEYVLSDEKEKWDEYGDAVYLKNNDDKKMSIQVVEDEENYHFINHGISYTFSKESGLLTNAKKENYIYLTGGPFLHTPYFSLPEWKCIKSNISNNDNVIQLMTYGMYGDKIKVLYIFDWKEDGTFSTTYRILEVNGELPRRRKLRVGVDCGGLDELGIYYLSGYGVNSLEWKRNGLFTTYPEDHIGRNYGVAIKQSKEWAFGNPPDTSWKDDGKNFILNGRYDTSWKGTNDFRSTKENIIYAKIKNENEANFIFIQGDGTGSIRLEVEEPFDQQILCNNKQINYQGTWYEVSDSGSSSGKEMWSKEKNAYAEVPFEGVGIIWYGPKDLNFGRSNVWLDGNKVETNIDQRVEGVDFPGSSDGFDKKYNYPLYTINNLNPGKHTLKIEVLGEKADSSSDSNVVIDRFHVLKERYSPRLKIHLLLAVNYPHIAWGNYQRQPILLETGLEAKVSMQLL